MQNNSENEKSNSFLKKIKALGLLFIIILLTIIIIILLIFYLIEKIINLILTLITFTRFISIPLQIILHILLIRYIILEIAFSGQNLVISRSLYYSYGKIQANHLYTLLLTFTGALSVFNDIRGLVISSKELNSLIRQIDSINYMINGCLEIFNKIKNKFNELTVDQYLFYNNLNYLKDALNNGNLINFINETIQILEKSDKKSLADLPDDQRNDIVSKMSGPNSNNLNIQKILVLLKALTEQIKDFIGDDYSIFSKRYIKNYLYNKLFGSLEQFHIELVDKFNIEEHQLITKDKCQIEYIIVRANQESPRKKLMIICGPNGVPYQVFIRNLRFEGYLQSDVDLLCWNYRGYGFSKGKPSYNKLRTDVLELFDEVKNNSNYERFAVHGISIGGIPCCHLARNRKEIELMICDRNFGRLDNITQGFYCGKFFFFIYKYFFFQSTDNVDNYLNVKCDKILLNDAKDKIVIEICSLKTLVSKSLCEQYLECKIENSTTASVSDSNNNSIIGNFSSRNNELETLSSKKSDQSLPLNTLNDQIKSNEIKNEKLSPKKTALDKILDSVEDKNIFIHSLISVSNLIDKDKLEVNPKKGCLNTIINYMKKNSDHYSNLTEEELHNTSGIFDFVKEHMLEILDSVQCAGDSLFSLIEIKSDYTKSIYIDNFFNNMFIWGSVVPNKNDGNLQFHKLKNIKNVFKNTMKLFEEFMNSQEIMSYKQLTLVKEINNIYKYFSQITQNLEYVGLNTKNGFIKLIKEKEDIIDDKNKEMSYEKCLMELNRGYYVPLYCGHNGSLSKEEKEMLDNYLMKSPFMNNEIENIQVDNISTNEDLIKINSPDSSKNIINIV